MEFSDLLRLLNAMLGTLCFLAFAIRINDDWINTSHGWRVLRLSLLGLLFVLVFASIEVMRSPEHIPLGIRTFMIPVSTLGVIVGLWMVRHESPLCVSGWISTTEARVVLDGIDIAHHGEPCTDPGCAEVLVKLREKIERAEKRS